MTKPSMCLTDKLIDFKEGCCPEKIMTSTGQVRQYPGELSSLTLLVGQERLFFCLFGLNFDNEVCDFLCI